MRNNNRLSARQAARLCGLVSAAMLMAAFGFEYLGELAPCKLCLWQRWPHGGGIAFSLLAGAGLIRPIPALILIAACAATTAGIAGYHVGVEQHFWPGPASCSAGIGGGGSAADLLDSLLAAPVIRCDQVAWDFAGISMAGWNMALSACMAGFAVLAASKAR